MLVTNQALCVIYTCSHDVKVLLHLLQHTGQPWQLLHSMPGQRQTPAQACSHSNTLVLIIPVYL